MKRWLGGILAGVIMTLSMGCTPAAAPTPTPPPTSLPSSQEAVPPKAVGVASPEQATWDKVVAAAKKEGRLTIYSSGGLIGDAADALTKPFRERTGIQVEIITGQMPALMERLKVEKRLGMNVASLMTGAIVQMIELKGNGILQPLGYLPSLADKSAWGTNPNYDGEGYIIISAVGISSPWIRNYLKKARRHCRRNHRSALASCNSPRKLVAFFS